jgi:hypothetical protein
MEYRNYKNRRKGRFRDELDDELDDEYQEDNEELHSNSGPDQDCTPKEDEFAVAASRLAPN